MTTRMLSTARAEGLFSSHLPTGAEVDRDTADEAVRLAIRRCTGVRGCVAEMAVAFAEHPETAVPRMHWARTLVGVFHDGCQKESERR